MNFLFILVFSCITMSVTLTTDTAHYSPSSCVSDIKIVNSEKELLDEYTCKLKDGKRLLFSSGEPNRIYRLNTKTGELKEVNIVPIIEKKKKMIEQEEEFIRGYEIK